MISSKICPTSIKKPYFSRFSCLYATFLVVLFFSTPTNSTLVSFAISFSRSSCNFKSSLLVILLASSLAIFLKAVFVFLRLSPFGYNSFTSGITSSISKISGLCPLRVLISSFRGADDYVSVDMASLGEGVKKAEVYIVDKDRNLELDRVEYFTAEHAVQILKLSRYMTVYIKITKE